MSTEEHPFHANEPSSPPRPPRKPPWLKIRLGGGAQYANLNTSIEHGALHTICQSGRCPNQGECWSAGAAAFMILGGICTRNCRFCATPTGKPLPPDPQEPQQLAQTVRKLTLKHVVITSVDRDDLPDGGAAHWAETVECIRAHNPGITVEVLLPDFMGKPHALERVLSTSPEIAAHNLETVERLTPSVRSRAQYRHSLHVLEQIALRIPAAKSGLMLGLGETEQEVHQTLQDLRAVGCRIVTLGQYLQPTRHHHPVMRYLSPGEFSQLGNYAYSLGFSYVESGPLVRSSFHADRALKACGILTAGRQEEIVEHQT